MRETEIQTNENGTMRVMLDAQMSKMSPEQRVAMASLNQEAKKLVADRLKWDAHEAKQAKEKEMQEVEPLKVDTPFKEAHGEDIDVPAVDPNDSQNLLQRVAKVEEEKCLPDPLEPQRELTAKDRDDIDHDRAVAEALEDKGITNSLRYSQETLAVEMKRVFDEEIMALREAGQKEYAHESDSPFANFERGTKDTGIDRKRILWIYAMKHKDGIAGFLQGQESQREDVPGRSNDLIVYLLLLRGMINEEVGNTGNFGLGKLEE